jgi:5'-nucleotidase
LKGIKVCRQGYGKWKENFVEREDPHGKKYYWLTGEFINMDKGKDNDLYALSKNYAALVPIDSDLTKTATIKSLTKKWNY